MNFNHLEFLIYSSHKTSTQTLISILNNNKYKSTHCHNLNNFKSRSYNKITNNKDVTPNTFIQGLINYKNIHNKKIKIISCIRNPKDRLLSSFFQSFSTDEIEFLNKKKEEATVTVKNEDELCSLYEELIKNKKLPGKVESVDDLSYIFGINIIEKLENRENHYYLDHELFELYVLDFNQIIGSDCLNYLKNIFKLYLKKLYSANLTSDKYYYSKYKNVKKILGTKLNDTIQTQYDTFYFTAFNNEK